MSFTEIGKAADLGVGGEAKSRVKCELPISHPSGDMSSQEPDTDWSLGERAGLEIHTWALDFSEIFREKSSEMRNPWDGGNDTNLRSMGYIQATDLLIWVTVLKH